MTKKFLLDPWVKIFVYLVSQRLEFSILFRKLIFKYEKEPAAIAKDHYLGQVI